jgi:hypothetical protein
MLAQVLVGGGAAGGTFVSWAILIVGVSAIVALVFLALRQFGVQVPPFIIQGLWIVLAAVVIIGLIVFVARLAGFA